MLDLKTMTQYATFGDWVKSWPKDDLLQIREHGYDDWDSKPGSRELRKIYLAFKPTIWYLLKDFTDGDVTGYLFEEEGYLANSEAEMIDILVGCAIEVAAGWRRDAKGIQILDND